MKTYVLWVLAVLSVLGLVGCGGSGGPVKVAGKVSLDGKPLDGATVQFLPDDGTGTQASGITGSDGSFRLTTYSTGDGARPGTYKVIVSLVEETAATSESPSSNDPKAMMEAMKKYKDAPKKKPKHNLPVTYSDPKKTTLKQVVPTNGEVILELRSTGG